MLRTSRFGAGLSYTEGRKFTVDKTANDLLATYNTTPFRDVVIPARTVAGVFVKPFEQLMLAVDVERIERSNNAVYVSAATTSTEYLKDEAVMLTRAGVEWTALRAKFFGLILRGGGYQEPTRIVGGRDRNHVTYGFEVRAGPAVFSYGADRASSFQNTAYGLGVTLENF